MSVSQICKQGKCGYNLAKSCLQIVPISPVHILSKQGKCIHTLQKPHFQIMPIYNSFIIFLIGFSSLVGEFLPQTPNKNRRENLKIFSPSGARWA